MDDVVIFDKEATLFYCALCLFVSPYRYRENVVFSALIEDRPLKCSVKNSLT